MNDYTLPLKRNAAEAAVDKAGTDLEKVKKQANALLRNKLQAVESGKRSLERAQSDLDVAKEEMDGYEVHSPVSGMLTYGNPDESWRRGDIEVGGNFSPGRVIMTIPNRTQMQAVINIPEADIQNIRVGQRATVSVEALADRRFPGVVSNVAEVANSGGWWSSDVKEFKVIVALDDAGAMKPGYSCQVQIVTDTIPDATYLPVQAVFREGERFYVYPAGLVHGEKQEIKLGRASVEYVEILDGVKPGMKVLLNPKEPLAQP